MKLLELDWYEFTEAMDYLSNGITELLKARLLYAENAEKYRILGVPRGGLPIAVQLSHSLNMPLTTEIDEFTLLVDDIYDSGTTSRHYENLGIGMENQFFWLKREQSPKEVQAAVIVDPELWVVFPWETNPEKDKRDYESKNAITH